ncbi:MAG: site-specific integrase [Oligoflexia bacterium]|nr:site-specific integrase [Oligoflexia bacterium]
MEMIRVSVIEVDGGRYIVSFRDPNTQKRKRKYCSSLDEAEQHRQKVIIRYYRGALCTDRVYMGHLIQAYVERYPNTKMRERKNSFESFYQHFSHFEVNQVDKQSLQYWFDVIKKENNYSNHTLSRIKCQINRFFKHLIELEINKVNPISSITFNCSNIPPTKDRVLLSGDEIKMVLERAKEYNSELLYPFIYIAIHTGARKSEIIHLRWSDVDFETSLITFKKTKNGQHRQVKMSNGLYRYLLQRKKSSGYVIYNPKKKNNQSPIRRELIQETILYFHTRYPDQKQWRLHSFRHSFAYNFLKRGGSMYTLQAILGHKHIDLTVDLYGNLKAVDVSDPSPFDF